MLKSIDPGTGKEKVWNPQVYSGDKRNIVPIITPAYPSMCATDRPDIVLALTLIQGIDDENQR
jgi:poly(A) polymerase Pap1